MTHRILPKDDRGQVDREALARAVQEMTGGGIYVREVDAGDGHGVIVVSDEPLNPTQAPAAYRAGLEAGHE